jgi:hypothetical protein
MTGPIINESTKSFYDEMKITDNCTFSDFSNKHLPTRNCQHTEVLSSPVGARLTEFYCIMISISCHNLYHCLLTHISQVTKCQHNITITVNSPLYQPTAPDCGFLYPSNRITIKHAKTCATAQSMGANVHT